MGLIMENDMMELAYMALFVFWMVFVYFVKNYDYWAQRGVPHVGPVFPLGSFPQLVLGRIHHATAIDRAYQQFRQERFFGVYEVRLPTIVINDPDIIKDILSKKFNYFTDRCVAEMSSNDCLNHNLLTMKGAEWKEMRLKLSPAYTACKMKLMFFLVKECSDQLYRAVEKKIGADGALDVDDLVLRFTVDVIGSCAFGLDVDTLSNKNSYFFKLSKGIMRLDLVRLFKIYMIKSFPVFSNFFLFNIVDPDVKDYIMNIIRKNVAYREANHVKRFDFLDLLIKIRQNESILDDDTAPEDGNEDGKNNNKKEGMMIEQIAAETYVFFAGGFESSSSVISFCLYELSCNQDIQDKVFKEVDEALNRYNGEVSFQAFQEMTYLDQVINETLRRYPPFSCLNRTCTKSYEIPESEVTLEEGLRVIIPVYSLQHDPKYYPDPYKFDPERFSPEKCKERHQHVFLPFGEGPRMCIGLRFGLMLVKAAVVTLVKNYSLSLTPDTPIPLQLDTKSFVLQSSKPLWLVLSHRKHQTL